MPVIDRSPFDAKSFIDTKQLLYLDGENDFINVTNWSFGSLNNNHDWSISFFIKPEETQIGGTRILSFNSTIGRLEVRLGVGSNPIMGISIFDGALNQFLFTSLKANILQYVALVYSSTENKIDCFINGVLVSTYNNSFNEFKTGLNNFYIGKRYDLNSGYFKGYLGHFRIYSKNITDLQTYYEHNNVGYILKHAGERCIFELSNQRDINLIS